MVSEVALGYCSLTLGVELRHVPHVMIASDPHSPSSSAKSSILTAELRAITKPASSKSCLESFMESASKDNSCTKTKWISQKLFLIVEIPSEAFTFNTIMAELPCYC